MSLWINRTVLSGSSVDRNGTNSHTCTFTPATSGNFLIAVIAGGVTSTTPSGWTLVQSAINFSGLYVFSKTASASESSFSTTHNATNYPLEGVVYEFYASSAIIGTPGTATGQARNTSVTGPNTTGLSGTYTRFAARSFNVGLGAGSVASCAWTTPSSEDYDALIDGDPSTDGIALTIAYDDNSTGSSFTPSSVLSVNTGTTGEGISFALSASAPPSASAVPAFRFGNSLDAALQQNLMAKFDFTDNTNDSSGNGNNATVQGGVTATTDRRGTSSYAYSFNGSTGFLTTTTSFANPTNYTMNAWFKTTTNAGGVLVGFCDSQTGTTPSNYDRIMWMDTTGRLNFGVWTGAVTYITSSGSFNDGNWHMATATMSTTSGMVLYVDGTQVGTNANTTSQLYTGWWRIGHDNMTSWPAGSGTYFSGTIDDVKIYNFALNSTQVSSLYAI